MLRRVVRVPHSRCSGNRMQMRYGFSRNKVISAEDAACLVHSGNTVAVGGFVAQNCPEEILAALEARYRATQEPKNLSLIFEGGPGDSDTLGVNHFGNVEGMVSRTIGSHYGQVPALQKLVKANKIAAYNLPMGSISRMIRASATKSPGHITTVGYGTLADPQNGGGRLNALATEDVVKEVEILGKKYLLYIAEPIHVAIIRGTTADLNGNISMERESLLNDNLVIAMAARSARGVVLAQVERITGNNTINPRHVHIPGTLVDGVVVAQPENHKQSFFTSYNPYRSGELRRPPAVGGASPLTERKIIARRAAMELQPSFVVNLGIGMPEGVATVAKEEGIIDLVEMTTEPGIHGGEGASGHDFGPAENYSAVIEMNQQFDFYNGGGLDTCFLGMAEVTQEGHVNVTKMGNRITGPGGFIDISQSTQRVNLLGTMTAGGLKVKCEGGKLKIVQEGKIKKFVKSIPEITLNGTVAMSKRQTVRYITERCVFYLTKDGLVLAEIAPGMDLQKDILDQMEFTPIISPHLKEMNAAIFGEKLMGLKGRFSNFDGAKRIINNKENGTLYIDLSNLTIRHTEQIDEIEDTIRTALKSADGRVDAVVNYFGFDVDSRLEQLWQQRVGKIEAELYKSVKRLAGRSFFRHAVAEELHLQQAMTPEDAYSVLQAAGILISKESFSTYVKKFPLDAHGKISTEQLRRIVAALKDRMDHSAGSDKSDSTGGSA